MSHGKCQICDYDEIHGSSYAGLAPSPDIKVLFVEDRYLCTQCLKIGDEFRTEYDNEKETDAAEGGEDRDSEYDIDDSKG